MAIHGTWFASLGAPVAFRRPRSQDQSLGALRRAALDAPETLRKARATARPRSRWGWGRFDCPAQLSSRSVAPAAGWIAWTTSSRSSLEIVALVFDVKLDIFSQMGSQLASIPPGLRPNLLFIRRKQRERLLFQLCEFCNRETCPHLCGVLPPAFGASIGGSGYRD